MTEPIERQIAKLKLPAPSSNLDRRIGELLEPRPNRMPERRSPAGVLAMAGGTLAAGILGLVLAGPSSRIPVAQTPVAQTRPAPPVVETVVISIPLLNGPSTTGMGDEDGILSPGRVVVSTSTQSGDEQ